MNKHTYRTGDLYLENTWTLNSLLTHAEDPDSRWSNAGIFIIDNDLSLEDEDRVKICLLVDGRLVLSKLDTVLRRPILQAAAIRSLDYNSLEPDTHRKIKSYTLSLIDPAAPVTSLSHPMKTIMANATKNIYSPERETPSIPSGFVKGNPNHRKQSAFTPQDLIASILASAGIIPYNPDYPLSFFQQGNLDSIYSEESPLFPRPPDLQGQELQQYILQYGQQELKEMLTEYHLKKSKMELRNFMNYKPVTVNSGNLMEDYEKPLVEAATAYPEQQSNYNKQRRQGLTTQIAEEKRSQTQISRLRRKEEQSTLYTRPKPNYRGK